MGVKKLVWMLVGLLSSSAAWAQEDQIMLLDAVDVGFEEEDGSAEVDVDVLEFTEDEPTSEEGYDGTVDYCDHAYDDCILEFNDCLSYSEDAFCDQVLFACYDDVDSICTDAETTTHDDAVNYCDHAYDDCVLEFNDCLSYSEDANCGQELLDCYDDVDSICADAEATIEEPVLSTSTSTLLMFRL